MLEFYPMPTNLNHVAGLYPLHHQTHGSATPRYMDNRSVNATTAVATAVPNHHMQILSGSCSTINNNNNMQTSPTHSACLSNGGSSSSSNNNNNNATNSHSPTLETAPLTAKISAVNNNNNNNNSSKNKNNNNNNNHLPAAATAATATTTPIALSACSMENRNHNNSTSSSSSSTMAPAAATAATTPTPTSASPPAAATTNQTITSTTTSAIGGVGCVVPPSSSSLASLSASASSSSLSSLSASKLSSGDCNGRTEVGHIKCERNYEICEGCGQKIHDRYLMNVGETNWHEHCLACCYCGMQLHHTCYVRNTKIYCKIDYERMFSAKCAACCHPILPHEMVMRPIPNYIFHLSCFVCYACRLPLQKGEQFMMRDGQLFCYRHHDLEKELFLAAAAAQHCGYVGLDEDDLMRPRDGRRGPKRPRTILTSQQRKQFKASFDQSPKPCRKVREALAKDTGLSVRVVQVWFQNQRAKMKKIQRKAKNGSSSSGGGGGGAGSGSRNADDKDKENKDDKCMKHGDSGSSSETGYQLSLDSAFATQPLNPNLPFSPDVDYPANSNDSFCSSDLSLEDGSNFDQLEGDDGDDSLSLNNLDLQSTGSSGHHHNHHHHNHGQHSHHSHHSNPHDMLANLSTSLINPIDKLYLMQNSYFNTEP